MRYCDECGAQLEDGTEFCDECGAKIEQIETNADDALKNKKKLPILIMVGALIMIAIIGAFFIKPWSKEKVGNEKAIEETQTKNEKVTANELKTESLAANATIQKETISVPSEGRTEEQTQAQVESPTEIQTETQTETQTQTETKPVYNAWEKLLDSSLTKSGTVLDEGTFRQYSSIIANASTGVLPLGKEIPLTGNDNNYFAVEDVDNDGNFELLISIEDTYDSYMSEFVYEYNSETGILVNQFVGRPGCRYYVNGTIESVSSHYGSYSINYLPYDVEKYIGNNQYEHCFHVFAWENIFQSESFPKQCDKDNNGIVMVVFHNQLEEYYDETEFENFMKAYIGDGKKVAVDWTKIKQ